jgi:hypothetical protein
MNSMSEYVESEPLPRTGLFRSRRGIAVPFVQFRNALGRGFVVPDAYGGTKLIYLLREPSDLTGEQLDRLGEESEVVVQPSDEEVGVLRDLSWRQALELDHGESVPDTLPPAKG